MTTVTATAADPAVGAPLSTRRGLLILLLLCGAQFLVVLDATIVNVVPRRDAGVAAGLVNTMQRVGSSVGLAVLTAVATARTRALAAPGHLVTAVVGGYDRAFLIAAAFAAAASMVSLASARTRRVLTPVIPDTPIPAAPAHADAA